MAQLELNSVVRKIRRLAGAAEPAFGDELLLDAFARRRDEAAFAELVARHGALVQGVCRRTLGHRQDAEDAFQATFLVLARCPGAARRGPLAAWLYGISHRIAMNAKRSLARRRAREKHGARPEATPPSEAPSWHEVQGLLDEEVARLPELYRRVFVLCCLEEHTKAEAARQLGLREGTVSSRLAKARRLLQERLGRRGVTLSALLAAVGLARAGEAVSATTVRATAAAALAYAAGACASSAVPASAAALANGVTPAMLLTKTKLALALLLAGLLAAGAGVLFAPLGAAPAQKENAGPAKEQPAPKKEKGPKDPDKPGVVRARVLDPVDKPVRGAKVYRVSRWAQDKRPGRALAESDADGWFRLPAAPAGGEDNSERWMAVAPGFGPALLDRKALAGGAPTFRLVKDDVPVIGQVVSLEGKPLRGVTVRPVFLYAMPGEDLGPFLKAVAKKDYGHLDRLFAHRVSSAAGLPGLPARLTTDAEGRFRFRGAGRDRVVGLQLSGPDIETEFLLVATWAGKPFRMPVSGGGDAARMKGYPAVFRHAAGPGRPVTGTVRDLATGKPIAGVRVHALMGRLLSSTTDKDGTYRLPSLPAILFSSRREPSVRLQADPPAGEPYLPAVKVLPRGRPGEAIRADFTLARGVWAEGRILDKKTGQPVRATVTYFPDSENAQAKDLADYAGRHRPPPAVLCKADGSFRLAVLTGPGVIVAWVYPDVYLKDQSLSAKQTRLLLPPGFAIHAHAVRRIHPKADEAVRCDMRLDPGETQACTAVGPDGKPVSGTRVSGLTPTEYWNDKPLPGADFTLRALRPKESREVLVLHPKRELGAMTDLKPGTKGTLAIRLAPTGTLTGRVLDPDGRPLKEQGLSVWFTRAGSDTIRLHLEPRARTDGKGRFRIPGLLPGLHYQIELARSPGLTLGKRLQGLTVKSGEVKDLGDVNARNRREE
jgi:RNA polymerase sigma factor (sigma-70 family)